MTGGDDVESALAITNGLDAARRRLEDPTTWALVERVAEATATTPQLHNGGHHDATGSVPPHSAIADVWTIA